MVSQLRLVDFGYSCRSPEEGKSLRTKVGSPYYVEPACWYSKFVRFGIRHGKVAPEVLEGKYGKEQLDSLSYWSYCDSAKRRDLLTSQVWHVELGRDVFHAAGWDSTLRWSLIAHSTTKQWISCFDITGSNGQTSKNHWIFLVDLVMSEFGETDAQTLRMVKEGRCGQNSSFLFTAGHSWLKMDFLDPWLERSRFFFAGSFSKWANGVPSPKAATVFFMVIEAQALGPKIPNFPKFIANFLDVTGSIFHMSHWCSIWIIVDTDAMHPRRQCNRCPFFFRQAASTSSSDVWRWILPSASQPLRWKRAGSR